MLKELSLAQISLGRKTFSIRLTQHAQERLLERKIDSGLLISAITAIGFEAVLKYSDKNVDIMVEDKQNGFSVVFCVVGYKIRIITVIDKTNCFVKEQTVKINLQPTL